MLNLLTFVLIREEARFCGRTFHDRPETFRPFVFGSSSIFTISPCMSCLSSTPWTSGCLVSASTNTPDAVALFVVVVAMISLFKFLRRFHPICSLFVVLHTQLNGAFECWFCLRFSFLSPLVALLGITEHNIERDLVGAADLKTSVGQTVPKILVFYER